MIRAILFILILKLSFDTNAQISSLSGYKEFISNKKSIDHSEFDYSELINLASQKHTFNIVVPMQIEIDSQVLIVFYNTKEFQRRRFKNYKFNYLIEGYLEAKPTLVINKTELNQYAFNIDSVRQHMANNMIINTEMYNAEKFLDSNISLTSNICCKAEGFRDRFSLIYYFFLNGILLDIKSHNFLGFVPY